MCERERMTLKVKLKRKKERDREREKVKEKPRERLRESTNEKTPDRLGCHKCFGEREITLIIIIRCSKNVSVLYY